MHDQITSEGVVIGEPLRGYRALTSGIPEPWSQKSGQNAPDFEVLAEANPEVLVSDIGMPDQDGFDLIREIRARGHHAKDLPAVALSAFVHKNDRRQALLAGFQMHVSKPADPHDLTAVIASLAGRTGPAA
jgi:CheY-like chemotaxis protein